MLDFSQLNHSLDAMGQAIVNELSEIETVLGEDDTDAQARIDNAVTRMHVLKAQIEGMVHVPEPAPEPDPEA